MPEGEVKHSWQSVAYHIIRSIATRRIGTIRAGQGSIRSRAQYYFNGGTVLRCPSAGTWISVQLFHTMMSACLLLCIRMPKARYWADGSVPLHGACPLRDGPLVPDGCRTTPHRALSGSSVGILEFGHTDTQRQLSHLQPASPAASTAPSALRTAARAPRLPLSFSSAVGPSPTIVWRAHDRQLVSRALTAPWFGRLRHAPESGSRAPNTP